MSLCRFQSHSKKDILLSKIWKLILLSSVTLFLSMLKKCHKNIKWNWLSYSATVKLNLKMLT